jgi:hypothetical protein
VVGCDVAAAGYGRNRECACGAFRCEGDRMRRGGGGMLAEGCGEAGRPRISTALAIGWTFDGLA